MREEALLEINRKIIPNEFDYAGREITFCRNHTWFSDVEVDGFGAGHPCTSAGHILRRDDKLVGIIAGGLGQNVGTGALEFIVLAVKGGVMAVAKRTADRRALLVGTHPVLTAAGATSTQVYEHVFKLTLQKFLHPHFDIKFFINRFNEYSTIAWSQRSSIQFFSVHYLKIGI